MSPRWEHHIIKSLREHRSGKEGNGAQSFRAIVHKIVTQGCGKHEYAARLNIMHSSVFESQFSSSCNNILGFLCSVCVPAEPSSGLDFIDNCR